MFSHCIQSSRSSIFPIIATIFKNGRYLSTQVAGTGFFIDNEGHFATALHVVNQIGNPNVQYGSLGTIPHAKFHGKKPEVIQEIGRIPQLDLFVGKLENNQLNPFDLHKTNSPEGTSIVIGGYPFPNIKKTGDGSLNFSTVRQYWQSAMIMDNLSLSLIDPKLNYHGFLLDKRTIPGMSGGPALNVAGEVVGMCTALITRTLKNQLPNINGVCLDANNLYGGIQSILRSKNV